MRCITSSCPWRREHQEGIVRCINSLQEMVGGMSSQSREWVETVWAETLRKADRHGVRYNNRIRRSRSGSAESLMAEAWSQWTWLLREWQENSVAWALLNFEWSFRLLARFSSRGGLVLLLKFPFSLFPFVDKVIGMNERNLANIGERLLE